MQLLTLHKRSEIPRVLSHNNEVFGNAPGKNFMIFCADAPVVSGVNGIVLLAQLKSYAW